MVLDIDIIGEKLRNRAPLRRETAMEGILMHGMVNEQSSPGHSRSEYAQELVWHVVSSVLVRTWGTAQGPNNYEHIILIRVLK